MFLHVQRLKPTKDYELRIKFTNRVVKDVDLRTELYGSIFEPICDLKLFKQARVNEETGTAVWLSVADFAPECLYETGREVKKVV